LAKKKYIPTKELIKIVESDLIKGKSKNELFEELSIEYYESNTIAKAIAMFPDNILKKKYNMFNTFLLLLIAIYVINKMFDICSYVLINPVLGLIILAIYLPISLWIAMKIYRPRAYIYNIIGVLSILSVLYSLKGFDGSSPWVGSFMFSTLIAVLSYYIGSRMFPNYGFRGPKKDSEGKYIL